MNLPHPRKPLVASAICILSGLVVVTPTLFATHPLAFVAFILGGGMLMGAGVLLYLTSLALGWWMGDEGR